MASEAIALDGGLHVLTFRRWGGVVTTAYHRCSRANHALLMEHLLPDTSDRFFMLLRRHSSPVDPAAALSPVRCGFARLALTNKSVV
jgi:hypothetical protein